MVLFYWLLYSKLCNKFAFYFNTIVWHGESEENLRPLLASLPQVLTHTSIEKNMQFQVYQHFFLLKKIRVAGLPVEAWYRATAVILEVNPQQTDFRKKWYFWSVLFKAHTLTPLYRGCTVISREMSTPDKLQEFLTWSGFIKRVKNSFWMLYRSDSELQMYLLTSKYL